MLFVIISSLYVVAKSSISHSIESNRIEWRHRKRVRERPNFALGLSFYDRWLAKRALKREQKTAARCIYCGFIVYCSENFVLNCHNSMCVNTEGCFLPYIFFFFPSISCLFDNTLSETIFLCFYGLPCQNGFSYSTCIFRPWNTIFRFR